MTAGRAVREGGAASGQVAVIADLPFVLVVGQSVDLRMSQCCSLVVLCVGSVAAMAAIAAVGIAINTDHWSHVAVDRQAVRDHGMEESADQIYYTRAQGLFRTCFTKDVRPPSGSPGLFLNSVENWCYEKNYGLSELVQGVLLPSDISHFGGIQLHLARSAPCLLIVYLFLMVIGGMIGLSGCWRQSSIRLLHNIKFQYGPLKRYCFYEKKRNTCLA